MTDSTDRSEPDLDLDDDQLMAALRRLGALDAPSADMIAAAKAVFVWRTLDAELAELTYDSIEDDLARSGIRSTATARRSLTFEASGVTVEVEATIARSRCRLVGQLVPPQPGRIDVRHRAGSVTVAADEAGRFSADDLPPGPLSLRCQGIGEEPVSIVTDWVLV